MLKAGLTGGIASGKTTVAAMLAARGAIVLDADRIAHEQIARGKPAYGEIVRVFGSEILAASGEINREQLAERVFSDPELLQELNRIVHPHVIEQLERELARIEASNPSAIVVIEAALLIETGYARTLDKLIVTWSSPDLQRQRLIERGLKPSEADARLAAQLPGEAKRRQADYVIDCSGTLESTEAQVQKTFEELSQLAAGKSSARSLTRRERSP